MDIIFRNEQEKILNYKKGIMSISAVPGAGKTFILVYLIKKLLENNFDKNKKILLLTYMNSAVNNFQERMASELTKPSIEHLEVKTIHKLGQDILRENFGFLELSEDYSLIDSPDRMSIITKLCKSWYGSNKENLKFLYKDKEYSPKNQEDLFQTFQRAIANMISKIKMEGISPNRIYSDTKNYKRETLLPVVAQIYKEYQQELNKKGALDYDDLLFYTYKLLKEKAEIRKMYQEKYLYIFEDEAQDSNKLQNKILALLTEKGGNLVKVGDSNQSIMGTFTSSTPKIFRDFIKNAPIKMELSTAGRSSLDIIKLANNFHKFTREKHPCIEARDALVKPYIRPVPPNEYPQNPSPEKSLSQVVLDNEFKELDYLIYFIKTFNKRYPEKNIGILVPRNSLITSISHRLNKEGMDFSTLTDVSLETLEALKKLGDIVSFLAEPSKNVNLINLLKLYFLPEEEHLDKNLERYLYSCNIEDLFYSQIDFPENISNSRHFSCLLNLIDKLIALLNFSMNTTEKILIYIGDSFDFSLEHRGLIENIAVSLKKIFKFNPKWTLSDLAKELKKTENNRLGFFSPVIKDKVEKEKKIVVTTYHKSKGREWDMVYLFGMNSYYFPVYISKSSYGDKNYLNENYLNLESYMAWELEVYQGLKDYKNPILDAKIEKIAESIRLIFVGITRAKEYLVISNNKDNDDFYIKLFKKLIERINNG